MWCSMTYFSRTQSNSCPGNFTKSVAKAPLKRIGEFLKPSGGLVQESCYLFPMCGFSHSLANSGWLTGASWRQKKAYFKCKQVNCSAVEGISPSRVYSLDTAGCRVIVALIMLLSPEPDGCLASLASSRVVVGCSRVTGISSEVRVGIVCLNEPDSQPGLPGNRILL